MTERSGEKSEGRRKGRPQKREGVKTVSFTIRPELWQRLEEKAQSLGMTRSELIESYAQQDDSTQLAAVAELQALGESCAS